MTPLAADHNERAIDALRRDAEHWRGLYHALWSAAAEHAHEQQRTIAQLHAQLADYRATWRRFAVPAFEWTAAQETGEDA